MSIADIQKGVHCTCKEFIDVGVEPPCINQGMCFRIFFVLNRVRVSNPQQLTYTQILFKYPLPQGSTPVIFLDTDQQGQQNIKH